MAKWPVRPPRKSLRASPAVDPRGAPTANYGWTKPTIGGDLNAWGTQLNADLDGIDSTVHGVATNFSATAPAMDGTAAAGSATTFAHSDHVHPTDTSRYAASNPSGYQTAAQVTASLGSYLPLAGGTLTGALVPSQTAGLTGTTTNNNANAGAVGEVIASNIAPGAVTGVTSVTQINITSISLTAGDWDVYATGATNPGLTTVTSVGNVFSGISTTSATLPSTAAGLAMVPIGTGVPSGTPVCATACMRLSIAATTTVYLVLLVGFTTSTMGMYGNLWARRAR